MEYQYPYMFRFQTGSIKRRTTEIGKPLQIRFDSKLVRLKVGWQIFKGEAEKSFDSKLVRLKDHMPVTVLFGDKFRFQTGSIKREIRWYKPTPGRWFRFQTGSIKSGSEHEAKWREVFTRFDSKLVRLKEGIAGCLRRPPVLFRFQTGSIKRDFEIDRRNLQLIGFDSKLVRLKAWSYPIPWTVDRVSIPNWFD